MFSSALSKRYIPAAVQFYSRTARMSLKAISSKDAAALDKDLMEVGGWSLDQLMELAGLSVSQAVYRLHPPSAAKNVLVVCGPGNNGGDGLVAARHLAQYGYSPSVYYPKEGKNELYKRLKTQLHNLSVPFVPDFTEALKSADFLVDAIFGFSFGGPLRDPFPSIISQIESSSVPVLSVDAPSSWDIQSGPPKEGPGAKFMPEALISLTAPKPCVKYYRGRHFIGGRFLTKSIAEKYGLDCPKYPGIDQVMEIGVDAEGRL
ncbi:NADHX epimerase [Aspergillus clavatus NRRL 1]|uniref:NAD(P)H-hydrate epimerase n=1 Tax=Aspergillus clavatus (strain ATCC 1007 / CBS 513.65 / DSM 816 / NCTC 3887 / NRRL 1 / QM 1276 / 107) TaxID=344612 RepID=A1CAM2_ASPCL|nr:AI-BP family protein [Aspergillus clavatus NRRL 1]EAW12790.1 AI-BP family protein [Aspergillus clavatus NRRL 1]